MTTDLSQDIGLRAAYDDHGAEIYRFALRGLGDTGLAQDAVQETFLRAWLDQPGLTADAGIVRHTWGTELKLDARGLTAGDSYAVTFVRDDGERVSAGTFLGAGDDPVHCSVNAAVPVDAATELMITDAGGALVMDARLH